MFRKLIIAVLTLGLLLTFSSAVLSSDAPHKGLNPVEKINQDAPRFQDLMAIEHSTPAFQKPITEILQVETPSTLLPPQYFCEFIDYSGGASAYFWKLPDVYGDIEQGMRFTPAEGYTCTLLAAYIGVYGSYLAANPGAPDMLVTVYGDDGFGLPDPGNVLGSVVVPNASLPTSGAAYVPVDLLPLGPLVFTDGEEFHVGVSVDGFVEPDTLAILSDDGSAGTGRSWENWAGFYGFMLDDWGIDVNFLIGVDLCCGLIPYTECYVQDYACNVQYYWSQPDAYGDDYFNMRFSVEGPETLMEIGVATYDNFPEFVPGDLDVFVWGDDGFGFPDLGNVIYQTTIPFASVVMFPAMNVIDLSGMNIIMTDDFHVGWSTNDVSGGVMAGLSDDGSCGTGRSSEYWGVWGTMLDDWGVDVNFLIYAYLCKDEFAKCKWISEACNLSYFWRLPDRYGDIGDYQLFSPSGLGCRLEEIDMYFYWPGSEAALPLYTYNSEVQIYDTDPVTGLPLNKLAGFTLTPADYVIFPGATAIDVTASPENPFLFDEDIWIGVESFAPDTLSGIRTLSDDGTCGNLRSCENWAGSFFYMLDDWGDDVNFLMEAYVCCVPLPERPCFAGDQWPTMAHNFARDNASVSSLGADAQGNLTKAWEYVNPLDLPSNLNSASIFGEYVGIYQLDYLAVLDINDGTEIWNYPHDGFHIGSGCYSTPTIYDVAGYGPMLFTAGGDSKAFTAFDLLTGAIVWTHNFMYHNQHFMTYGPSVIIDCGGTEVIVYSDDNGDIYASEALTGTAYAGWTVNPINLGGGILKGLTTDGTTLYVGIDDNVGNGDIFAVDGCTGATIWQFAQQQLCTLDPGNCGPEAFTGSIAYDLFEGAPTLFVASSYNQYVVYPPYNDGGVMYSIDATTGALNWAALCIAEDYNGPAVDAGHIIHTGWNGWVSGGTNRGPIAFNKSSGSAIWANTTTNPGLNPQHLADGILSCETEKFDFFVIGDNNDFLKFYNSDNGEQMFHRRMAGNYEYMHHYSPAMDDGHFIIGYLDKLICLTEQEPRPRLDLPRYSIYTPVEFGSADNHTVVFPMAIGNTGGAPLTIDSVRLGDDDNDSGPPDASSISIVDPERVERIAEKYGSKANLFRDLLSDDMAATPEDNRNSVRNNAAYAYPAWIYGLTAPVDGTVLPPQGSYNDSSSYVSIDLLIDGTQVPRGLTPVFATIYSDDPDYFLDSARIDNANYAVPQILLGIVGGCLYDNVAFTFGVGAANSCLVFNSPMLLDDNSGESYVIDGDASSFFQGAFLFATEQLGDAPPGKSTTFSARVALHSAQWHANPEYWESLLPDPNCYDQTCPPNHRVNVLMGSISNDEGASYEDVYGEIVAYAFVDSVTDNCTYDTLGNCTSWDWLYEYNNGVAPPLNDTLTIGFHGCGSVFGAYDQPLLNNFVIYKFDLSGRYAPIEDLYMGAMLDCDIGTDVAGYDEGLSISYDYDCSNPTGGWGMVKIPFGCGYTPMRGAKTIESQQGPWNDSDIWLDSVHYWMSSVTGLTHQTGAAPCMPVIDDRDVFFNIAEIDMPQQGTGVTSLAIALFGLPDLVDPDLPESYADIANTANKWCGFGRGDVNNDNVIDLVDIALMIDFVYYGGDGPYPFLHLGDVNANGAVDGADVAYLIDYYFNFGPCIQGDWTLLGY